jgi:hypothetical protein
MTNANDSITGYPYTAEFSGSEKGLTKREYFAAIAMQGLLSGNPFPAEKMGGEYIAKYSAHYADALINELNKPQP